MGILDGIGDGIGGGKRMAEISIIDLLEKTAEDCMEAARENRKDDPGYSYCLFSFSEKLRNAAEILKRQNPQEMELEGGGSNWWYVCPECHGAIDCMDHFCRHCGQAVKE